jgi:TrmH family RNA methyltransferase
MPVSKNQIKLVNALAIKKFRDETGLFFAEGSKLVRDMARGFACETIFVTHEWLINNELPVCKAHFVTTDDELKKLSQLKTPQGIIGIFRKPESSFNMSHLYNQLILALDGVQDPGNFGTIIRIADWFGIDHIVCSPETVDAFSPKVVQATMGALASVNVLYTPLADFLTQISASTPVYGTFMEGNNIYTENLTNNGIIVLGNEGNGISPEIEQFITQKLLIPDFSDGRKNTESLNVAMAGAIVCSEFRRRYF